MAEHDDEHDDELLPAIRHEPPGSPRCGYCGEEGHNVRTCVKRAQSGEFIGDTRVRPPGKRAGTRTCGRCCQPGHRADRCLAPYPVAPVDGGGWTIPESLLVCVISSREADGRPVSLSASGVLRPPGGGLSPKRCDGHSYGLLVYGDGEARVYVRDQLDGRLGSVPWAGSLKAVRAHFDAVEDGAHAPVQVALSTLRRLLPGVRVSLPEVMLRDEVSG